MRAQIHTKISGENVENIDAPNGWFTANEMHDAYLKGKEKGKKHFIDSVNKTLSFNLPLAATLAEKFIAHVEELYSIKVPAAYLKIEEIAKFSVLFLVPKEDFLSPKMRNAYILAEEFEHKENSFEISFSFTILSENIKEENINSDGYKLKHEPRKQKTKVSTSHS